MAGKRKRELAETEDAYSSNAILGKRRSSRLASKMDISVEEMEDAFVSEVVEAAAVKTTKISANTRTKGKATNTSNDVDPTSLPARIASKWKVGAHVSAAGGVENSVLNAARIGANAFALFLKSQRKWTSPALSEQSISLFKSRMQQFSYEPKHVLPHGSYLINLGNPDEEKRGKSYECFLDDLKRCDSLGLELYNFHPGSTVGTVEPPVSISHIAECINRAHRDTQGSKVVVVLENMAGAGNIIGSDFAQLGDIIHHIEDKSRVGVCLDTCHMFAAGYDIRTKEGWDAALQTLDENVGLKYLRGMHINDSKTECGSKKDRHENIGIGHLSLSTFAHILTDPRVQDIALVLETPSREETSKNWDVWKKEIEVLNTLSTSSSAISDSAVEGAEARNTTPNELKAEKELAASDWGELTEEIRSAVRAAGGGKETKKKEKADRKKAAKVQGASTSKGKKGKRRGRNDDDEESDVDED